MAIPRRRLLGALLLALPAIVIGGLAWQLLTIQLRLSRNGKLAHELVESLEAQFPGTRFHGAASYEREVIYLGTASRLDEADRKAVEQWLRQQRAEQSIAPRAWLRQRLAPQIWLRFEGGESDVEVIIK